MTVPLIPSVKMLKLHRDLTDVLEEPNITRILKNINRGCNWCNVSHHMQLSETTIKAEKQKYHS